MFYFPKKIEFLTIERILELTDSSLIEKNEEILKTKIFDVKSLKTSQKANLSFYTNPKYINFLKDVNATACFIKEEKAGRLKNGVIPIINKDPHRAFVVILNEFYGQSELEASLKFTTEKIAKTAKIGQNSKIGQNPQIFDNVVISDDAEIGDNVIIMPNTFIGAQVKIGNNCIIHDNCSLMFTKLGNNCIIRSGARIGTSGFGFVPNFKTGEHCYIPQVSGVVMGNNVDIGANSIIDRGCLENTEVGDNAKLDNLVQIGHGAKIGSSAFIAAQAGLAGSSEIGKFVFMGPQSGVAGHLKVADFTTIIPQSGIAQDVKTPHTILAGTPAIPKAIWERLNVKIQRLLMKEKPIAKIAKWKQFYLKIQKLIFKQN